MLPDSFNDIPDILSYVYELVQYGDFRAQLSQRNIFASLITAILSVKALVLEYSSVMQRSMHEWSPYLERSIISQGIEE